MDNDSQNQKMIDDANKAIRLNPKDALSYYNRGMAYANKMDYVRSISDYTDAIELGLDTTHAAIAYYNRGVSYKNKGIYFKAIADFEKASSLNPGDREAREALEKAKGEQFRHSDHENARAWGLNEEIKKIKLKQAIEDYTEELRVKPNSASAYYNRGMAYKEQENYYSAIKDLEKAVELEPANDNYSETLKTTKEAKQEADKASNKKRVYKKYRKIGRIVATILAAVSIVILFATLGRELDGGATFGLTIFLVLPFLIIYFADGGILRGISLCGSLLLNCGLIYLSLNAARDIEKYAIHILLMGICNMASCIIAMIFPKD